MKKKLMIMMLVVVSFAGFCATGGWAGEMDILVNKLVEKGILSPYEGQILKAEAKEEAAKELAQGKAVTAPAWTQKIKIKGDARFRTQVEWGKGRAPAHQRIRNRVRARLGVEGKVNGQIDAGIYAVTGGNDPRSTNITLDDGFETQDFRLDAYYIKWTPELNKQVGNGTVWLGKFKNPFKKTALLWDGDICPMGVAAQYLSPGFDLGEVPTNLYGNFGFLWLDELSRFQDDPLMFVFQGGLKMDIIRDWDSTVNLGAAYYITSHVKNNANGPNYVGTAGTNTYNNNGTYKTGFDMVDILFNYDSKRIFDLEIGHGLYSDLIWNTDPEADKDFAWMLGGYIGRKKPKKAGQWKIYGEYRYIERDAVPDFLPDSDFYGFVNNGTPEGGGTNGKGFVGGIKYAVLKNTVLGVKYYYCTPIDIDAGTAGQYKEPYQLLQMDIAVKF
ncbi:MAG: putative porin [Desulfobacteraceae bacterium]|nr:putative porin [Desulfobacteraceae bacterium]